MAQCVIKKKKGLEITFGETFENVDCRIDLREEIVGTKITILILASLEDNSGFPEDRLVKGRGGRWQTNSWPSRKQPHSDVKKSEIIIGWPSPLGWGVGRLVV